MRLKYVLFMVIAVGYSGCGGEQSLVAPATPTAFNAAGAPTIQFDVPDMMCEEGCAAAVKGILSKQPGAKDVVVDFVAKLATVAVEEGKFDAQQALAALVDKGFDHSTLATASAVEQHVEAESPAAETPVAAEPPVR